MNARHLVVALLPLAFLVTMSPAAAQDAWEMPRTERGHPNLQGNWTNATLTPIQRPQGQDRVLSWEEVVMIEGGIQALLDESFLPEDPDRAAPPAGGVWEAPPGFDQQLFAAASGGTGGYETFYIDPGERVAVVDGEPRSSLITIPENGRLPPLTDEARNRMAERAAFRSQFSSRDHPELLSLSDRCIVSFGSNAGPPMLPNNFYNNNYTIVQTEDHVVILTEMVHDARIVLLGDAPPLPEGALPWFGDSRGWWDGDTLVVETDRIRPVPFSGVEPSERMKVTERFTLVDDDTILYEFLVEDPHTWQESWGGEAPMSRMDGLVYEYACHEGNYAMENILRGARFEERQAEARDQDD